MKHKKIKIRYFDDSIPKLEYIEGKSDWIDLRCAEAIELKQGEFAKIRFGIALQLPKDYEAHILPRSSAFKNWGILQTNSMGIIDTSYCGNDDEWMMPVYATRDTRIEKGDRVAQFRIVKNQPTINFKEVIHLDGENRGGFGSTGKK